jgi:hypothetical protein
MTEEKKKPPGSVKRDMVEGLTAVMKPWTRQKKMEEKQPGMIRYRTSRLTMSSRVTQKEAAWKIMEEAYMAASGGGSLPALARQIYYQARPKIMALTENKELNYGYFSQVLLPDYIEEHGESWRVVYDARGHFEEPHTGRRMGCGTIEVGNYLHAMKEPEITDAEFDDARVKIIGPSGNIAAVLFCEKEGFGPLFKDVDLANRYDLMIVSTKGVSVTAARLLIDEICGGIHGSQDIPLFVLHDFDVAGFLILGTLHRDTRRYQFSGGVEPIDLGLRLGDIGGLASEPAAKTKTSNAKLSEQLAENGATGAEISFLLNDRVELNALASDALIAMIERKLKAHGLDKVIPDGELLEKTYREFHRSDELREAFEEVEKEFEATEITVPKDLREQVSKVLDEHPGLRWDDAVHHVLGDTIEEIEADKKEVKKDAGDFSQDDLDFSRDDNDDGED